MPLRLQLVGLLVIAFAMLAGFSAATPTPSTSLDQSGESQLHRRGCNWSSGKSECGSRSPPQTDMYISHPETYHQQHPGETDLYPPHLDAYQQQYPSEPAQQQLSKKQLRAQKKAEKQARIEAEMDRKLQSKGGEGSSIYSLSDHQYNLQRYKAGRRIQNQDARAKHLLGE